MIVLAIIGAFALAAFGGGIAIKVMLSHLGSTLNAGDIAIPAYIWLFSTVIADIVITTISELYPCVSTACGSHELYLVAVLRYLLSNKTGHRSTDDLIGRLARVTFQSQLPPTLIAIGLAVEYTIEVRIVCRTIHHPR
jgi:hypothetical protein